MNSQWSEGISIYNFEKKPRKERIEKPIFFFKTIQVFNKIRWTRCSWRKMENLLIWCSKNSTALVWIKITKKLSPFPSLNHQLHFVFDGNTPTLTTHNSSQKLFPPQILATYWQYVVSKISGIWFKPDPKNEADKRIEEKWNYFGTHNNGMKEFLVNQVLEVRIRIHFIACRQCVVHFHRKFWILFLTLYPHTSTRITCTQVSRVTSKPNDSLRIER